MEIEERKIDGLNAKLIRLNNMLVGIATDIGPRILYLASTERRDFNLFRVLPQAGMQTLEGFWRIYGGHRFWSSPEAKPRSYSIDDKPVKMEVRENCLTVYGNPEAENSVQKEIKIESSSENGIQVVHTIENIGRWPVKLGCWALSVMRQGGFAIIPLKPSKADEDGLLPDRHVSLWPYTDLSDERLVLKDGYVFVRQNPEIQNPFKIGAMANPTWTAYWVDGMVFAKQFTPKEGEYPDFGCSVEVYTNADMLELETLGPLRTIGPSERIQHAEIWKIFDIGELTLEAESIKDKLWDLLSN